VKKNEVQVLPGRRKGNRKPIQLMDGIYERIGSGDQAYTY